MTATQVLDRFAIEEAPARWTQALPPVHDLMCSGLADPDLDVQVAALREVGRLWSWLPGCSLMHVADGRSPPGSRGCTARWSAAWPILCAGAGPRGKPRPGTVPPTARPRSAPRPSPASACCPSTPRPSRRSPTWRTRHPAVRQQVIVSFAGRRDLLTEDDLLKRLHDQEPAIRESAEIVLTTRGLTRTRSASASRSSAPSPSCAPR